jgi:hypothetical protein
MTTTNTIGGGTLTVAPKTEPYNEFGNYGAFAVIKSDGSVFAWGNKDSGGDISSVASQLDGTIPVTQIYSNQKAFAALRSDGSVVTWGSNDSGGNSLNVAKLLDGTTNVIGIFSSQNAFAALREDGSVITWGKAEAGGDGNVYHNVYYEGSDSFAEIKDYSVATDLNDSVKVKQIYSEDGAFAALRADGSVIVWGMMQSFATSWDNSVSIYHYDSEKKIYIKGSSISNLEGEITNVKQIYSTDYGFAGVKENGEIITWTNKNISGRDGIDVIDGLVIQNLIKGSVKIDKTYDNSTLDTSISVLRSNGNLFVAPEKTIRLTGVTGGQTSSIQLNDSQKIIQFADNGVFLLADGSIFTIGDEAGIVYHYDYSTWTLEDYSLSKQLVENYSVAEQLDGTIKIIKIYSNQDIGMMWVGDGAFAALREDGSVVTWGDIDSGGDSLNEAKLLDGTTKVIDVFSSQNAFAALREDGSVITWGNKNFGGDSSTVAKDLNGDIDVKEIYSNGNAFAAIRVDGSVVTWWGQGSDCKIVEDLTDVVSFANPTTDDVYIAPVVSTKPTSGNDRLTGTANNDKLSALAGNDKLIGGLGADTLTGGKGADTFKYTNVKDSGTTAKTRDTITDFKHSEGDKIDLSAIDANDKLSGDQAFTFIGTKAFSKTDATGQLRFDATAHILYGSTNADTTPEFSIQLNGVKSLVVGDFIL